MSVFVVFNKRIWWWWWWCGLYGRNSRPLSSNV